MCFRCNCHCKFSELTLEKANFLASAWVEKWNYDNKWKLTQFFCCCVQSLTPWIRASWGGSLYKRRLDGDGPILVRLFRLWRNRWVVLSVWWCFHIVCQADFIVISHRGSAKIKVWSSVTFPSVLSIPRQACKPLRLPRWASSFSTTAGFHFRGRHFEHWSKMWQAGRHYGHGWLDSRPNKQGSHSPSHVRGTGVLNKNPNPDDACHASTLWKLERCK